MKVKALAGWLVLMAAFQWCTTAKAEYMGARALNYGVVSARLTGVVNLDIKDQDGRGDQVILLTFGWTDPSGENRTWNVRYYYRVGYPERLDFWELVELVQNQILSLKSTINATWGNIGISQDNYSTSMTNVPGSSYDTLFNLKTIY